MRASGPVPADLDGVPVRAYRNLHCPGVAYSLIDRSTGRVAARVAGVTLEHVTITVQPGGQARARADRQRNVHAFVNGTVTLGTIPDSCPATWSPARYNPFTTDTFTLPDGTPVHGAAAATLDDRGLRLLPDTTGCTGCPVRADCPVG